VADGHRTTRLRRVYGARYAERGEYMMTETPTRQMSAPMTS
jgi:hypothetical protein